MAIFGICVLGILNLILYKRIHHFFNPFTIMSIFFFTPMIISTLRLSDFQNKNWNDTTNDFLIYSFLVWGLIPLVYLLFFLPKAKNAQKYSFSYSSVFARNVRILGFLFIALFLIENYIIFGNVIPLLGNLVRLLEQHNQSISGVRLITKSSPGIVLVLLLNYIKFEKKLDLWLMLICFLLPLTRVSRFEVFMSVISGASLFFSYRSVKFSPKAVLIIVLSLTVLLSGLSFLSNYRTSTGGKYDEGNVINYARYNADPGPGNIYAWMYAYFSLPFEDFNNIVTHYHGDRYEGKLSLSPIVNGLLFFDSFTDWPNPDIVDKNYNYYFTNSVAVPTALAYFYLDLGLNWGCISMAIYMVVLLYLYQRRNRSRNAGLLYSLFLGAFSLSAFQAVIMAPYLARMAVVILLPFVLNIKFLNGRKKIALLK